MAQPGGDQRNADPSTRNTIVQLACIAAIAALAIFDLRTPTESVPDIVYGTLLGVVLMLNPFELVKKVTGS